MRLKSALTLAGCVALASLANAQTPPPTAPPKGQTTPIQPVPTGQAPIQPAPTGKAAAARMYPPALYQMNDVGTALKLNQDQITRLNGVTEKVQGQYAPMYGKLDSLPAADRFARVQELNRLYAGDWTKSSADILDADQRLRYQQLMQQQGGFNTLYDPDVQKRLNLTPEQVTNLRTNVDWSNQQYTTITGVTDPTKRATQYGDYRTQYQERFNKFLTADQQKVWREMTGELYAFQPNFTQIR